MQSRRNQKSTNKNQNKANMKIDGVGKLNLTDRSGKLFQLNEALKEGDVDSNLI